MPLDAQDHTQSQAPTVTASLNYLVYANRVGETASVQFSPSHRWVYFSGMRPDEVLLIKCHDSATDGRARLSFHSAFEDPNTPADAPPRESIELRTLVFFADAA